MSAAEPLQAAAEPVRFDVLIVGAGLSGIGAAWWLQDRLPNKTWAILESREAIGGTWDLFRYPGIRSDSDMHTLGFSFRPWRDEKAIADGPTILNYVRDTAREFGIDRHIRFSRRAVNADWDSARAVWRVEAEGPEGPELYECRFLYMCSGYYDYDEGYRPTWPGEARFAGTIVHPQHWPQDLDYADKRVVVIGSGATAVTLVPEMARTAAHVTMLQRSPTWIVARPARDAIADWLHARLPAGPAHTLSRWKNVLFGMYFFNLSRRFPAYVKRQLLKLARRQLPEGYDVETHFTPRYDPWDQRLCLIPDADLFEAIKAGRASVVTDRIETFTEAGLKLASGAELEADVIVTATGLKVKLMGGMGVSLDGRPVDLSETLTYKGMMYSGVPNLASAFGYTNASWTLKCELTSAYVCRLIAHMDARGLDWCMPVRGEGVGEAPALDLSSGYVRRAVDVLPKQGDRTPWRLHQNYILDLATLKYAKLEDGAMTFGRAAGARRAA